METEEPKQSPVLVHGDSQHASEVTVIPCSDKHDTKENGEKVICPYCQAPGPGQVQVQVRSRSRSRSMFQSKTNSKFKFQSQKYGPGETL